MNRGILLIFIACNCVAVGLAEAQNEYIPPEIPPPGRILPPGMKPSYHDEGDGFERCVPIRFRICQKIQYNVTMMPNWSGMSSQEEASKLMNDYEPLLNIKCSNYLRMFLCTVYFPMCTSAMEKPTALRPCKALCLHVKNRCEPILYNVKHKWPVDLNCDDLPDSPQLCVQPVNFHLDTPLVGNPNENSMESFRRLNANPNGSCSKAELKVIYEKNTTCLNYCEANLLYRYSDKQFAQTWLLIWSVLCFISSSLTLIAFLTDRKRFNYPERPIAYLAMSYLAYSFGFLLRLIVGYKFVACHFMEVKDTSTYAVDRKTSNAIYASPERYLIEPGHENTWCTMIFLIINYFGSAASMWWVMLSISWYLSASRKWSHEGVESVSSVFHMFAWALPAVQTILILILHKIDAEELTGLCSVGNQNANSLLYFVILPHGICLLVGLIFLILGFLSVFRVRRDMKAPVIRALNDDGSNRRRLEKLIAKLGVFTILYAIPISCLLIGHIYDFLMMPTWRAALFKLAQEKPNCLTKHGVKWSDPSCHPDSGPSPEAGMLKIFTSLVVGITSGMWVWANKKTCVNLQYSLCRLCFCQQNQSMNSAYPNNVRTNGAIPGHDMNMNREHAHMMPSADMPTNHMGRINNAVGMISSTSGGSVAAPSPNTQLSLNSTVNQSNGVHINGQLKPLMYPGNNNNASTSMSSPEELSANKAFNMNGGIASNQSYHVYDFTGSNSSKNGITMAPTNHMNLNNSKFSCV